MTIHPLASPLSVAARPDLTGGRRVGVLLSHGFTGSPASMKPWGEFLAERGYAVEVPRLPGHGTTWQDMNKTAWNDWYAEASRVFEKLHAENDAVVVAGLSMGGALMLRLAADQPDRVAGVVVVNPALATKRLDVRLLPVLKHVVPSFPGITNDIKKPGIEEHGYARTPLRAAHSMFRAWPLLVADLPCSTSARPSTTSSTSSPSRSSSAGCPRGTSPSVGSRRASTSPPSTTTRRRSSRSPPTSSHGSPRPPRRLRHHRTPVGDPLTPLTKPV
jgi:carboxylesterase